MATSPGQQLRSSFLLTGVAGAVALAIAVALVGGQDARDTLERQANARGRDVVVGVAALTSNYMGERRRETEVLARAPDVIAAAQRASQLAAATALDRLAPAVLARHRALGATPELESFLRGYPQHSDVGELLLTDSHGFTVLATAKAPGFAHRAEAWWQAAWRDGRFEGYAVEDPGSPAATIEYAVAVRAPGGDRPEGVLRVRFRLDRLAQLLASSDLGDGAYLELVDDMGNLLAAPGQAGPGRRPPAQAVPRAERPMTTLIPSDQGVELVVSAPANQGRWWVLFRQPASRAYAAVRATLHTIWLGAASLLVLGLLLVWRLAAWLHERVTEPVRAAGAVASRVAGGDLSVTVVSHRSGSSEVGDLLSAVHAMVVALRRLVGAIRVAADEAAAMAAEISASTQEMSASTEEMSATCQDVSHRAAEQAQTVRAAADDTAKILQILTILAAGAEDSVRRNANLATLARRNKDVLDQSTAQLAKLADEVARGAEEAEALATASAEIQKFVTQAKTVATQTNMLALNAAIEAARAGPQGRGFAVVADEVRKLASVAAAAAGETADMVRGVLARVHATRERLAALALGGTAAREAAQTAAQGLGTVAAEAAANDAWSREIAKMTAEVRTLVEEITNRLGSVAQGTEGLLASTQEIAASSEQQSASTQEIAGSANQLAEAADKLSDAVKSFRLLTDDAPPGPPGEQAAD